MSYSLPSHLLRLFTPRPPLDYAEPTSFDKDPRCKPAPPKRKRAMTGVAAILEQVKQEAADRGEATEQGEADGTFTLAPMVRVEMRKEEQKKEREERQKRQLEEYKPRKDPHAVGDPFHTLFVSRLAYDVTEDELRDEMERYGPIDSVYLVRDKQGKSRGYAFILFHSERDQRRAFKEAEGIRIHDRRIKVDVERGRTVDDWKPTRLGGGLGGSSRKPKPRNDGPTDSYASLGGGTFSTGGGFGRGGRGGMKGWRGRDGFGPRGGGFGRSGGGGRSEFDGPSGGGYSRGPRDAYGGGYASASSGYASRNGYGGGGGSGYGPRGGYDRGFESGPPYKRPRW